MARLKPYHQAWLQAHPERSAAWLVERLADGFDVHHLDGDHANDDPDNLVLIEHGDHFRLHGSGAIRVANEEAKLSRLERGKRAYELRLSGLTWRQATTRIGGLSSDHKLALTLAKIYAESAGLEWPPRIAAAA